MTSSIAAILTDCQDAFSAIAAEFGYPLTVNGISTPVLAMLSFKLNELNSSSLGLFNIVQTRKYVFIIQASDYWTNPTAFATKNTFSFSDGVTTFNFVINIDAVPNPMQQFQLEASVTGFTKT